MENEKGNHMQRVTATQLKRMIDGDETFELINVLPEPEFLKEHIPGSINIPVGSVDFVGRIDDRVQGDRSHKIVVYCASVECDASPAAAQQLRDAGFRHVFDFEAGMDGWKQAGYAVESGRVQA
jgi:rhodanese-related sulfurtransferase